MTSTSHTYRFAGWSAIAFAAFYVLTFVTNSLISIFVIPPENPRPDELAQDRWYGALFCVMFALVGAAVIGVVVALRRLAWSADSSWGSVASALGVIGAAGLILSGAVPVAQHSYPAEYSLSTAPGTLEMQQTAWAGSFIITNAAVTLATLGIGLWLVLLALGARRTGLFGVPATVVTILVGVAPFATAAILGGPYGLLLLIIYFAGLGVWLLRAGRSASLLLPETVQSRA